MFTARSSTGALLLSLAGALAACATATDDTSSSAPGETAEADRSAPPLPAKHAVADYAPVAPESRTVTQSIPPSAWSFEIPVGHTVTRLRSLTLDGAASALVVDDDTMRTAVVDANLLDAQTSPASSSTYKTRLDEVRSADATLKTLRLPTATGQTRAALTIDMCQSSHAWEARLFDWLVQAGEEQGAPLPVGIAMTGAWANAHPQAFAKLVDWQATNKLAITWIDHSYTHPLHCSDAARAHCAFLTAPEVDMRDEVLRTERLLLSQGLVPSALFRFPGLTHDHARRAELSSLSLFAIDADAWLAKGETIHDGAVILVHGNGNESVGVDMFLGAMNHGRWSTGLAAGTKAFVSPLRAIE